MLKSQPRSFLWIIVICVLMIFVEAYAYYERVNSASFEEYLLINKHYSELEAVLVNISLVGSLLISTIVYVSFYAAYLIGRFIMKYKPKKVKYVVFNKSCWLIIVLFIYCISMLHDINNIGIYLKFEMYFSVVSNILLVVLGALVGMDYFQLIKKHKG